MSFEYKISIATPCFNSENTLPRVYESLLNQSFKEFEWIIVNDGSSDKTTDLIQQYIDEDILDIKFINFVENRGLLCGTNEAIRIAKGEYFTMIGHDDAIEFNAFENMYNLAKKYDDGSCIGVACPCKDQYNYFIGDKSRVDDFISIKKFVFENTTETWGLVKTQVYKDGMSPEGIDKFIPGVWALYYLILKGDYKIFYTNYPYRIYYRFEGDTNISININIKYPKGFEYEALFILNSFKFLKIEYPKIYLKFMAKYIIYSKINKISFFNKIFRLHSTIDKFFFVLSFPLVSIFKKIRG